MIAPGLSLQLGCVWREAERVNTTASRTWICHGVDSRGYAITVAVVVGRECYHMVYSAVRLAALSAEWERIQAMVSPA